jgi:hypothetical protein
MEDRDTGAGQPIIEMDWRKSTEKERIVRAAEWIDRTEREEGP